VTRRNDPCHCGSGKRYKQCCGRQETSASANRQGKPEDIGNEIGAAMASSWSQAQTRFTCPVCRGACLLFDVVDFNKSCEEAKGKYLNLSGIPVYYARCVICEFCFAPMFSNWSPEEFALRIYNDQYVKVDPDYIEVRPRYNAAALISTFGSLPAFVKHLDYGGGNGLLSTLLRESKWNSRSYDPFVDRDTKIEQLGKFDFITAYEVFEHSSDIQKLMSDLRLLLSPGGFVLFSTLLSDGNVSASRRLNNWWYASPRNGHISLFSGKSLARLAKNSGWNFRSSATGRHVFFTAVPRWASHIFRAGPPDDPA
jgi:SAM-dependent methyltransferase